MTRKMTDSAYTRREKQQLTPEILGQYHALVMNNDFEGFNNLLERYGAHIPEDTKEELRDEFMHYAARALAWKWRTPI
jgi:hypothetical protein